MNVRYNAGTMDELRARFQEIYADLPAAIRADIVVVIDEKPYSWNAVYTEVVSETKLGDAMVATLRKLGII
jgi:UV DNA damage repair endonuclease